MGGDGFLHLMNQTLEETMLGEGFSQIFLNDMVAPITRVNYGQSVRINAFVGECLEPLIRVFLRRTIVLILVSGGGAGAVSLAGADPGLWAVDGGNKRVCSGLLYHSKSDLIAARVTSITVKLRPSKIGSRPRPFALVILLRRDFRPFIWTFSRLLI